ncbi:MAG: hypothetical protein HQ541_14840, partial [Mariniphaga sp.]|nr:hypothetical protein [Mariniphaga sp.]
MRKKPSFYTVTIPVKPYVNKFLEINYGLPVNFTEDPDSNTFFQGLLKNPCHLRDNMYPDVISTYTTEIDIVISEHDFYNHGWELSKTDIVAFGKRYEGRAKTFMRSMVGIYHAIGLPINISIRKFQARFLYDEDAWPYESIKKDYYRNGHKGNIDFNNEIFFKIENIIIRNLSDFGTFSKRTIKDYDTTK